MRSMGIIISHKNNENRRALIPEDLSQIKNVGSLYFEKGYGAVLGYSDEDYKSCGANVVSRAKAVECEIITDVKIGDADYLQNCPNNRILLGWAHATQNTVFTDLVLANNHTVIAWEEMFENGRYIFYRNREIAGEAAILHAYQYLGKMPYETNVAILGNGQTAKGALRFLHGLGANIDVYGKKLEHLFKKNMPDYDILINCIMWDTNRTDRIIYRDDLKKLKPGTMIIDISCNQNLEIETSHPTTIDDPVYTVDGVIHYVVDNTPALFPYTVTSVISREFSKIVDSILEDDYSDTVRNAVVIDNGHIIFEDIWKFREKRGLLCK